MTLVSIGMPVRNGEPHVAQAIESLLSQSHGDLELIVYDNASVDATQQICRQFASVDRRVKYTRQQDDIGATANFEFVVGRGQGRYFMWAAADDRWSQDYVRSLANARATSTALLWAGRTTYVDETGSMLTREPDDRAPPSAECSPLQLGSELLRQHASSWIYGLFDRERLLRELPFLRAQRPWGGDIVFLLRLALLDEVRGCAEATIFKRQWKRSEHRPMTAAAEFEWQRWYAGALFRVIWTSPLAAWDKAELMRECTAYLYEQFYRRDPVRVARQALRLVRLRAET